MALHLLPWPQRHELKRPDADLAEVSNGEVACIHQPSIMTSMAGSVRDFARPRNVARIGEKRRQRLRDASRRIIVTACRTLRSSAATAAIQSTHHCRAGVF
jgi:hypothetical protein